MKNLYISIMVKYIITNLVLFSSIISLSSCSKSILESNQLELTYQMLSDKTWYLDYSQTITPVSTKTNNYIGQSTYFINLLKDKTTIDSDGIAGTYSVEVINGELSLIVNGKTSKGNDISYSYKIESVGANNLITKYYVISTNTTIKQFYRTK